MRRDDPGDRKRVARRLDHNAIVRAETLREQLQLRRPPRHPARPSRLAAVADRDLAEVAMHI
jgi:hypothetical protein